MSKVFGIILVIILLAAIGGGVYVYWIHSQKIADQEKEIEDLKKGIEELKTTETQTTSGTNLEFTETYKNKDFGYGVRYPEAWNTLETPPETDDPNRTDVVKFEDANNKTVVTIIAQSKDLEGMLKETFEIQKTTSVTIAQKQGEKLEVLENKSGEEKIYYLVIKGDYLYALSAAKIDADLLEEMVGTFSFTL